MNPDELAWSITEEARIQLAAIRHRFHGSTYEASVSSLKRTLCAYFEAVENCDRKQGSSISPVGSTADGGKLLKVRWLTPGSGKRGGLRLGFAVWCAERAVRLVSAALRVDL